MDALTPNLRDIGGRPTADGRSVAHGRVLRSAVPHPDDRGPVGVTWPPRLVIDLRSPSEVGAAHPLAADGVRVVNLPLLSSLQPGVAPAASLAILYGIVLDHAASHLVALVDEIGREPGTTLIHCAAGKDRTGISIALLLRLAGVSRDEVLHDYLLTEHALDEIDARLRPMTPATPSGHTYPPGFAAVAPDALEAVLDVWDAHPEGVEGWLVQAGGTSGHVDRLRRTLLI